FESRALRGPGERVRVLAHEEWSIDTQRPPVVADRLGDRQDVRFRERAIQRAAAVATGAKNDELLRIAEVRPALVVAPLQLRKIHQQLLGCGESRKRRDMRLVTRIIRKSL